MRWGIEPAPHALLDNTFHYTTITFFLKYFGFNLNFIIVYEDKRTLQFSVIVNMVSTVHNTHKQTITKAM